MQKVSTKSVGAQEIKRKAGRMLFIGLPGTRLTPETRELLGEVRPGGVILFGRNIESAEQVALLNAQIRDAAGGRVFIGVDQEGGLVDRFRDICEPAPSAKAVRDAGVAELAERFGSLTARVLRLLGFNMNFAPVLDLSGDNEENGLRARTFGAGPEMVSLLAGAYLDGMQAGRIVAVCNSFPGLGGSQVDWHRPPPAITKPREEIVERAAGP